MSRELLSPTPRVSQQQGLNNFITWSRKSCQSFSALSNTGTAVFFNNYFL